MSTAREIYDTSVQQLPVMERLRLACLILNGIAMPNPTDSEAVAPDSDLEATALAAFLMEHAGVAIPLGRRDH